MQLWKCPRLRCFLPLYHGLYDCDAELFFGDLCVILSREGSHQGCPLGGFFFLLSILECIVTVINAFPTVTAVGLADDYRFVGPELEALAAAELYSELVTAAGHTFCAPKSKVWSPSPATVRSAASHPFVLGRGAGGGMEVVPAETGLTVLGAPLGNPEWCSAELVRRVRKMQPRFDAIARLAGCEDPGGAQAAWILLRYSYVL